MRLWEYIKEKMLEHPTQTISEKGVSMTYEDLCIFAQSFAKKLTADYYGILCNCEMSSAMALLACIAAGKSAVPLPTRYGKEMYIKIWERAEAPCIITDMGDGLNIIPVSPTSYPESPEKDTAVILFTSGSTGKPKGIMLSQDNLICNIEDIRSYFPIANNDTILISRPLYHSSVLTGEFLVALCAGAKIVFTSESFQPLNILKLLKTNNVTVFGSTPTLMTMLSKFVREPHELNVGLLSVSGECITEGMTRTIRRAFPKADIYCGYGLSEASPRVAYLPAEDFDDDPTCAGIALPSVKIRIARPNGKDAARGEVGEILVKGNNVMTGYFDDDKRTRNAVRHGWLHTGDLGYIGKNGRLYIKGRNDDMIIRAGMNIYPAEIENVLSVDGRVREIQVYGYSKNGTQEIGMAISGDFYSVDEIMKMCRQYLPNYQIPSKVELVSELEKNTCGKRKRRTSYDL